MTVEVVGDLVTSKRRGIRSASSRMWVTMATMRPDAPSSSIAAAVTSRVSGSSVPNPSSRNREANPAAPSGAKIRVTVAERERQSQAGQEGLPSR